MSEEEDQEFPLMHAILYKQYGQPEEPQNVLRLSQYQDIPDVDDEEMLVEVYCFSVTRFDCKLLLEHPLGMGSPSVMSPVIPCADGAGIVAEVGKDVRKFRIGDPVFFTINTPPGKAAAEWVAVSESMATLKPASWAFRDAACLGSAASAALEAIDWMEFEAKSERHLLIISGASDVGSCAIMYCKFLGWYVTATAAGKEACSWCLRMGADRVIDTDEGSGRWVDCLKPHSIDGIFETRGAPHNYGDAEKALKKSGGCFASIAPKEGHTVADAASFLPSYLWRKIAAPFHYYAFTEYDVSNMNRLDRIAKLAASGAFRPITHGVYSFDLPSVQKAFSQAYLDLVPGRAVVLVKQAVASEKTRSATIAALPIGNDTGSAGTSMIEVGSSSKKMSRADAEAAAKRTAAKMAAESSWAAFRAWFDKVNSAITALSSPPEGIDDLLARQARVKEIMSDIRTTGRQNYEAVQNAITQAAKAGVNVGTTEKVLEESLMSLNAKIQAAEQAITQRIAKLESSKARSMTERVAKPTLQLEDTSSTASSRGLASDAGASGTSRRAVRSETSLPATRYDENSARLMGLKFKEWVRNSTAALDAFLSPPPRNVEEAELRSARLAGLKKDFLSQGKQHVESAVASIAGAPRGTAPFTEADLNGVLKTVMDKIGVVEEGLSVLVRKFEKDELDRLTARATEVSERVKLWFKTNERAVDDLTLPPDTVDDMKQREQRVAAIKATVQGEAEQYLSALLELPARVQPMTPDAFKTRTRDLAERIKVAEKAISKMIKKLEADARQAEAENALRMAARDAVQKVRSLLTTKGAEVDEVSSPANGIDDLRSRLQRAATIKTNLIAEGQQLYSVAKAAIQAAPKGAAGVSDEDLQQEILAVAEKIDRFERAATKVLRKMESDEDAKQKAVSSVDRFRTWAKEQEIAVGVIKTAPAVDQSQIRANLQQLSAIKSSIREAGKQLFEETVKAVNAANKGAVAETEQDLQAIVKQVAGSVSALEASLTEALDKLVAEETEREAKARAAEAAKNAAIEALQRFDAWSQRRLVDLDAFTVEPEGLSDMKRRAEQVKSIIQDIQNEGKRYYEACVEALHAAPSVDATEEDLRSRVIELADKAKLTEKNIGKMVKKLQDEEDERARKLAAASGIANQLKLWCQAKMEELQELAAPPTDLEDMKGRLVKVEKIKLDIKENGKQQYDAAVAAIAAAPAGSGVPVTEADLQGVIAEIAQQSVQTERMIGKMVKKMEAAEQAKAAALAVVDRFKAWAKEQDAIITSVTNCALDEKEVKENVARIEELQENMKKVGKPLYDETVAAVNAAEAGTLPITDQDVGKVVKELVQRMLAAEQKLGEMQEKLAADAAERAKRAQADDEAKAVLLDRLKSFHDWFERRGNDLLGLKRPPEDIDEMKRRADDVADILADIQNEGRRYYEACVEAFEKAPKDSVPITLEKLQAKVVEVVEDCRKTSKMINKMVTKMEEDSLQQEEEKLHALERRVSAAVEKLGKWKESVIAEVAQLSSLPTDFDELKKRLAAVSTFKAEANAQGRVLLDEAVMSMEGRLQTKTRTGGMIFPKVNDLAEEVRAATSAVSNCEKAVGRALKKEQSRVARARDEAARADAVRKEEEARAEALRKEEEARAEAARKEEEAKAEARAKATSFWNEFKIWGERVLAQFVGELQTNATSAELKAKLEELVTLRDGAIKDAEERVTKLGEAVAAAKALGISLDFSKANGETIVERIKRDGKSREDNLKRFISKVSAREEGEAKAREKVIAIGKETGRSEESMKLSLEGLATEEAASESLSARNGGVSPRTADASKSPRSETSTRSRDGGLSPRQASSRSLPSESKEEAPAAAAPKESEGEVKARQFMSELNDWLTKMRAAASAMDGSASAIDEATAKLEKAVAFKADVSKAGRELMERAAALGKDLPDGTEGQMQLDIMEISDTIFSVEEELRQALTSLKAAADKNELGRAAVKSFDAFVAKQREAIEAMHSDPQGIDDVKQRIETVAALKSDIGKTGKELFEQASAFAGDVAEVDTARMQASIKEVASLVSKAEKALNALLKKLEKEKADQEAKEKAEQEAKERAEQEAKAKAERDAAEAKEKAEREAKAREAVEAFNGFLKKQREAVEALQTEPLGIEDVKQRIEKVAALKAEFGKTGKELFEQASAYAGVVPDADTTQMQASIKEVAGAVSKAEKAMNALLKKLEKEREAQSQAEREAADAKAKAEMEAREKAEREAKAREAVEAFNGFLKKQREAVEALQSEPQGIDDVKQRIERVAAVKADFGKVGKELFDQANAFAGVVPEADTAQMQASIKEVAGLVSKAEKALNALLKKLEKEKADQEAKEKAEQEAKERAEQEARAKAEKEAAEAKARADAEAAEAKAKAEAEAKEKAEHEAKARDAVQVFSSFVAKTRENVAALQNEPQGIDDVKQRIEKVAALKADISQTGKELFDQANAFAGVVPEADTAQMQASIKEVAGLVSKAEKALNALLKKLEKEKADQEAKEKAEQEAKERAEQEAKAKAEADAAEAKAKAEHEAKAREAVEAFSGFLKKQREAVEALQTEPLGIEDVQQRIERVGVVKAEFGKSGKELFDQANAFAGVVPEADTAQMQASIKEVASLVSKAEKALKALLKKLEKEREAQSQAEREAADAKAKAEMEAREKAEREAKAREAVEAFNGFLKKQREAVEALQSEPQGIDDVKQRIERVTAVKADFGKVGKELFDQANAFAGVVPEADTTQMQASIKEVAGLVSKAEKALNALLKKLEKEKADQEAKEKAEQEAKERAEQEAKAKAEADAAEAKAKAEGEAKEKSEREAKAREAVEAFNGFLKKQREGVEALQSEPQGIDDVKQRIEKVAALKAEFGKTGKELFEQANAFAGVVPEADATQMQASIKEVAGLVSKAEKALNALLKKLEKEKTEQEAKERSEREAKDNEAKALAEKEALEAKEKGDRETKAREAVEAFNGFLKKQREGVEALQSEPQGIDDVKQRIEKVAALKADFGKAGKELFEQANAFAGVVPEADATQMQASIKEVAGLVSKAEKALNALLKKLEKEKTEQEAKAQEDAQKGSAETEATAKKALDDLNTWLANQREAIAAIQSTPPESLDEVKNALSKVGDLKASVGTSGRELYEKVAAFSGVVAGIDAGQMEEAIKGVATALSKAEKALTVLGKRMEKEAASSGANGAAPKPETSAAAAGGEKEQLDAWLSGVRESVATLRSEVQTADECRAALEKLASFKEQFGPEGEGRRLYEAFERGASDEAKQAIQEEMREVAGAVTQAEKRLKVTALKLNRQERADASGTSPREGATEDAEARRADLRKKLQDRQQRNRGETVAQDDSGADADGAGADAESARNRTETVKDLLARRAAQKKAEEAGQYE